MVFQQVASENNNNNSSNNPYISYSVTLRCASSTRLFAYVYIHQCNNVLIGTAQQLQMNRLVGERADEEEKVVMVMVKVTKNTGGKRSTIGLYRNHIVVLESTAVSSVHIMIT